jgi:hypothetical protein
MIRDHWVRHFDKLLNRGNENECVTFTTRSSNQISKEKTQDTIDAPHYWGNWNSTEEIRK